MPGDGGNEAGLAGPDHELTCAEEGDIAMIFVWVLVAYLVLFVIPGLIMYKKYGPHVPRQGGIAKPSAATPYKKEPKENKK